MAKTHLDIHHDLMQRIASLKMDDPPSQCSIVAEEGIFRLLRYEPLTEQKYRTPMVVCYAWINRPCVLDLQPDISIIQKYLRTGFDVYMLD
jgi:polyhydroxyalkanoate synthase subunit PhaC